MRSRLACLLVAVVGCAGDPNVDTEVVAQSSKVTICHVPPGHSADQHTIEVSSAATSAHLHHGDYMGACHTCEVGSTLACYSGPAGSSGVGACHAGTQTCNGSDYGACGGEVTPVVEICGDQQDNDCDGVTDEGCVCSPGSSSPCYDGPAGTEGVGACATGSRTCNEHGTGYGACTGSVMPSTEVCGDGLDNNCDGQVDDGCVCSPSSTATCYTGPDGTNGVGACAAGTQTCNANGSGYEACAGSVGPVPEVCGDLVDNDCDGLTDEGCVCAPGSTASCYDGPGGTEGVGRCASGTQTCNSDGTGYGACVGSVTPVTEVCGDVVDNDCDGTVDDGCLCTAGSTRACWHGASHDGEDIGTCVSGQQTCNSTGTAWGECVGEIGPIAEVCDDGLDNDCDGVADDNCVCQADAVVDCYLGPVGTADVGVCHAGTQTCNSTGTALGMCVDEVHPIAETCGDGLDNNCDGVVDDNCACQAGSVASCYLGPEGTAGVGTCHAGTQTCNSTGTGFGACEGEVHPVAETCGDGVDDDCDGVADQNCVCQAGSVASCYLGAEGTAGVGVCHAGTQTCNSTGTGFGACVDEVHPTAETCGDGIDNDCDGVADENCVCPANSVASCYLGPAGTAGVGSCRAGTQTCNSTGTGFGSCMGEVEPTAETCGDGLDNDCDGTADDGCVCQPDSTASCYAGPAGTAGVGTCHAGTQTCNASGTGFGACAGEVDPVAEACGDGLDNDCDGVADDNCVCQAGSVATCAYTGPAGTNNVGVCHAGAKTCNATGTAFGTCSGEVRPTIETCGDQLDNDCDGFADEACLGGRMWLDNPGGTPGIQDAFDTGVPGVIVMLKNSAGGPLDQTVTDANGDYFFSNRSFNNYRIVVVPPAGYRLVQAHVGNNVQLDSDFDPATQTATIFFDGNANYSFDGGWTPQ